MTQHAHSPFGNPDSGAFGPQVRRGPVAGRAPIEPMGSFERFVNPDAGGDIGLMGLVLGNRSASRFDAAAEQRVREQGLQAVMQSIRAADGSIVKGITQFLGTPEGQQAFASDPDFFKKLIPLITPPRPTAEIQNFRAEALQRDMTVQELRAERVRLRKATDARAERTREQADRALDLTERGQNRPTEATRSLREEATRRGLTPEAVQAERTEAAVDAADRAERGITVAEQNAGKATEATRRRREEAAILGTTEGELLREERREAAAVVDRQIAALTLAEENAARPTDAVRTGLEIAKIMDTDPKVYFERKAALAGTQQQQAIASLQRMGIIDEVFAAKWLAGTLKIVERMDGPNRDKATGIFFLVDSTPGAESSSNLTPQTPEAAASLRQLVAPEDRAPVETTDPDRGGNEFDALLALTPEGAPAGGGGGPAPAGAAEPVIGGEIVRGAGLTALVKRASSATLGQFFPGLTFPETVDQTNRLRQIKTQVTTLLAEGTGRLGVAERKDALRNVDNVGLTRSPLDAAVSLLALHDTLDLLESTALQVRDDPATTKIVNAAADKKILSIQLTRKLLPTREALETEMTTLRAEDPIGDFFDTINRIEEGVVGEGEVEPGAGAEGGGPGDPEAGGPPAAPAVLPPAGAQDSLDLEPLAEISDPSVFAQIGDVLRAGNALIDPAIPPELRGPLQTLTDVGNGFNKGIAGVLGIVPEAADQIMRLMFNQGFLDSPGDGEEAVFRAARELGFLPNRDKLSTFADRFGTNLFDTTLALSVMLTAAPFVAGAQATTVIGASVVTLAKNLITFSRDFPARFLMTEIFATGGATAGGDIGERRGSSEGVKNTLRLTGGIFGAGLLGVLTVVPRSIFLQPNTLTGAATARPGPFKRAGDAALGFGDKLIAGLPSKAKVGKVFDLQAIRSVASEAVQASRFRVNFALQNIMGRFAPKIMNDSVAESRKFVKATQQVYKAARLEESKRWSKVDLKADMTKQNQELVDFAAEMRAGASNTAPEIEVPVDVLTRVGALVRKTPRGLVVQKTDYKDYRGFRRLIRNGLEDPATPKEVRRNLVLLDNKLMDLLEKGIPDTATLSTARAYSRWLNQRFTEGPFAEIIAGGGRLLRADNVVNVARNAIFAERGPEFMQNVAQQLADPQATKAAVNTLRAAMREQVNALMAQAQNRSAQLGLSGVEADLQASTAGARGIVGQGPNMLENPQVKSFLEGFPKVAVQAQTTTRKLNTLLSQARQVEDASFKMFSDLEPDVALAKLLTLPNKGQAARVIRTQLENDPDALEALRFGLLKTMLAKPNGQMLSPAEGLTTLASKGNADVVRVILGDKGLRRVKNILLAAQDFDTSGASMYRVMLPLAQTSGRIVGAGLGRMLNTGTIQAPGITSNLVGRMTTNLVSQFDPLTMLGRAIRDPKMEALLLSRAPTTSQQFRLLARKMGLINASLQVEGGLTE